MLEQLQTTGDQLRRALHQGIADHWPNESAAAWDEILASPADPSLVPPNPDSDPGGAVAVETEFDDAAAWTIRYAEQFRRCSHRSGGAPVDLVLGALAMHLLALIRAPQPGDSVVTSVLDSLRLDESLLRTQLDTALAGIDLTDRPPDLDTVVGEGRHAPMVTQARLIARRVSPQQRFISQRHLLAAALRAAELPPDLVATLRADRSELASRLLTSVSREGSPEVADRWAELLSPELPALLRSDHVAAWRRRAGWPPPPPMTDELQVGPYATMIATMIARRSTPMPVSIGLFGEWGSGKSHFMRLVQDRIEGLRAAGAESPYLQEIVQISFNAWSYADTNLWASLAAEFFEQLGAPEVDPNGARRDQIQTSLREKNQLRMELDAVRTTAEERTREARNEYATAVVRREARTRSLNAELIKAVVADPQVSAELASLGAKLGFGHAARERTLQVADDVRGLDDDLTATRRIVAQRSLVIPFVLLLLALTGIGVALVLPPRTWSWLTDSTAVAAVVAFLTSVGVIIRKSRLVLGELRAVAGRAQEVRARMLSDDGGLVEEARALHEAEADEAAAETKVREMDSTIAALDRQLLELEPGRRLYDFIAERAASADYRNQLGVVSMVRRDFQQLVDLMAEWARQPVGTKGRHTPIDRIVLYIDDLDRCEPDQVVQVLQAVHLLLAMDLFVVVVGVDPRWLLRALRTRYTGILDAQRADADAQGLGFSEATPQNYLEKIFQIPFVLPAMGRDGFGNLMTAFSASGSLPSSPPGSMPPTMTTPHITASEDVRDLPPSRSATVRPEAASEVAQVIRAADPESEETLAGVQAIPIQGSELKLLRALSPLVRTPRAATRLFNVYGLLRSARDLSPGSEFLGSAERPGDYEAVAQLVGIGSGAPSLLGAILWGRTTRPDETAPSLGLCASKEPGSWKGFVDALDPQWCAEPTDEPHWRNGVAAVIPPEEVEAWHRLVTQLQQIRSKVALDDDIARYRKWAPQVARFSYLLSAFSAPG